MENLQIKILNPGNLEENELRSIVSDIITLRNETWLDTYPNAEIGITQEDLRNNFRPLDESIDLMISRLYEGLHQKRIYLYAIYKSKVAGFAIGIKGDNTNEIEAVYIHPSVHSKGIGKEFMKNLLGWLGNDKDIVLGVASYNDKAISFYKKHGFSVYDTGEFPLSRLMPPKAIPLFKMVKEKRGYCLDRKTESTKSRFNL